MSFNFNAAAFANFQAQIPIGPSIFSGQAAINQLPIFQPGPAIPGPHLQSTLISNLSQMMQSSAQVNLGFSAFLGGGFGIQQPGYGQQPSYGFQPNYNQKPSYGYAPPQQPYQQFAFKPAPAPAPKAPAPAPKAPAKKGGYA